MSALQTRPEAAAGPRPWRLTREEYYRLGELGFFDGKRVQLIRGEVLVMSPMGYPHRVGIRRVQESLGVAFGSGAMLCVQLPLRFGASEPEPDVSVVAGSEADYTDHPTTALLVVEVADSTLDTDLTVKAELYAAAGVPDYWVLDVNARVLHVLRDPRAIAAVGGHRYWEVRELAETDTVTPLAAPRSAIRVADLLP